MVEINSKLEFCENEPKLLSLIGRDRVMEMFKQAKLLSNTCSCCSYVPKESQQLKMHVLNINELEPEKSENVLMCNACYQLKHIDKAVENNWVVLANSEFSQIDLIKIQRYSNKRTNFEISKKRIVILKMNPIEHIESIKQKPHLNSPYIKVLFNKNFDWSHCR